MERRFSTRKEADSNVSANEKREARTLACKVFEGTLADAEAQGWESAWSFHAKFREQWDEACNIVDDLQKDGWWETILIKGQDAAEIADGVFYIYKRRTQAFHDEVEANSNK